MTRIRRVGRHPVRPRARLCGDREPRGLSPRRADLVLREHLALHRQGDPGRAGRRCCRRRRRFSRWPARPDRAGRPRSFSSPGRGSRNTARPGRSGGVKAVVDHMDIIGTKWLQLSGPSEVSVAENGMPVGMVSAVTARYQNPIFQALLRDAGRYGRHRECLRSQLHDPAARARPAGRLHHDDHARQPHSPRRDRRRKPGVADPRPLRRHAQARYRARARVSQPHRQPHPRSRSPSAPASSKRSSSARERSIPRTTGRSRSSTAGSAGRSATSRRAFRHYYGDAATRDLGYISTEGRHTIPLGDHSSDGVLYPYGAYYEFADAGADRAPKSAARSKRTSSRSAATTRPSSRRPTGSTATTSATSCAARAISVRPRCSSSCTRRRSTPTWKARSSAAIRSRARSSVRIAVSACRMSSFPRCRSEAATGRPITAS